MASEVSAFFSGPEELEDADHARSLLKELKFFYDNKQLTDVTIEVAMLDQYHQQQPLSLGKRGGGLNGSGRLFSCNRNVLAAASPYFKSMFTGGLYESKQKKVTIHDVDAESMALIIDYCYTGKVTISEGNVQRLYAAANMLQLEYVRQTCANFMARRLDISNCAGILKFADAFDNRELKGKALAFIARNFQQLCKKSEELWELSLSQIKEILMIDALDVDSERKVCSVAIQWIEANLTERAACAPEVLQCIRWQHLTEKDKVYIESIKSKSFIKKYCMDYIEGVIEPQNGGVTPYLESQVKRIGMTAKEMVIFFGHPKEPFLCYDPYSGSIYTVASPLTNLAHNKFITASAVCVSPENDVYLAAQPSKHLWVYNAVQNTWLQLAERLLPRDGMDVAYLNGHIYILGGRNPSTNAKIKDVECYNIQRNQWTFVAPLPHSLQSFELLTVNDYLYAVNNKRMFCYDPNRNQWLNCASLKRSDFQEACVFNDEIYCICDIPVMKVYNPSRGEWRRIRDIPIDANTHNFQIVRHCNKLLLITTTVPQWKRNRVSVHEYDHLNDQWINIGTMLGLLHYDTDFICLSARIYPSCLEPGQSFIMEEDEVRSDSSADWDFEGFSDMDSESGSSSSFSAHEAYEAEVEASLEY
ncbi:kelch repeat and BTB domain-containing protein 7 [Latimeria chalumnae]|uniref:Kelch repeat and BTB domain containing 7 n=1 Tax=Latimeria chalumnae TaxID=7897 RepID=H3AQ92_LATCH|nr:PREDICTED: kelch repeat and BTB domain-containing protein 7 [Latimeria chalumnae]XP_014348479.1 PREDICTED: kelch repeat and BTB domain-containing protein 7 [Latimeria chalumnae]|eukprot:XP_006003545.1 PREDICTED: kelch repeat and BTB domain-containing protein 7 [Latimeria chalumnae]